MQEHRALDPEIRAQVMKSVESSDLARGAESSLLSLFSEITVSQEQWFCPVGLAFLVTSVRVSYGKFPSLHLAFGKA